MIHWCNYLTVCYAPSSAFLEYIYFLISLFSIIPIFIFFEIDSQEIFKTLRVNILWLIFNEFLILYFLPLSFNLSSLLLLNEILWNWNQQVASSVSQDLCIILLKRIIYSKLISFFTFPELNSHNWFPICKIPVTRKFLSNVPLNTPHLYYWHLISNQNGASFPLFFFLLFLRVLQYISKHYSISKAFSSVSNDFFRNCKYFINFLFSFDF